MELDDAFCVNTLKALGCGVEQTGESEWKVSAPGWRYDLSREADLIEEAARFRGVDSMPATLPAVRPCLEHFGRPEGRHDFMMRVKRWAAGMGLNEAVNYSFVGNRDLDHLHLPQEGRVTIMNPLDRRAGCAAHGTGPRSAAEHTPQYCAGRGGAASV